MDMLETTAAVIDALGGNAKVRELTGARSQQAVFNWIARGNFPPDTFLPITEALATLGHRASPRLWKSVPVEVLTRVAENSADASAQTGANAA